MSSSRKSLPISLVRQHELSEVIDDIKLAGCLLNGSLPPDQEELTNKLVEQATDFTTYLETPTGDLWQKRNGIWSVFGTTGGGGQVYDIETTKPQDNVDIRPEGSFWYYKPVGSSFIEEIYVCMENDGGGTRWGLLDNFERMFEKKLISNDTGGFYAGFTFTEDIEKSTVPGSATTSYLKKNDYILPTLPSYTNFNATSGKDASNRFTRGSEINGGEFGMMKCLDDTTGACLWSSDLGAGNAYVNMSAAQVSELSQPVGVRSVRYVVGPATDGSIRPESNFWALDNWGATTDPDPVNEGFDKGYIYGSFYTNVSTGDIFFGTADAATNLVWRKIYSASGTGDTSFLNFIIEPTISEAVGGVSNFLESSFGSPIIKQSSANTPDFTINTVSPSGAVRIQYTGSTDKVFVVDFKITADTLAQNGVFEYALFKDTVAAPNVIDLSITVLCIDNAGINAYGHCSSSCTVNLSNGDEIHIGRRGINAAAQFITPVLLNFKITELK